MHRTNLVRHSYSFASLYFFFFVLHSFLFRDPAKHEEGGAGAGDAEQAAGGGRGVVEAAGARISNVNQNSLQLSSCCCSYKPL